MREKTAERGYGSRWRRARATFLARHPLCEDHKKRGQVVPATVVDHIIPHKGDRKLFWDTGNWQPLCAACHNRKTAAEDGGFGNQPGNTSPGCGLDGIPLDTNHHWHRQQG